MQQQKTKIVTKAYIDRCVKENEETLNRAIKDEAWDGWTVQNIIDNGNTWTLLLSKGQK